MSSESRRKLLKSIAAGSGAVIAGKSLPESWSKPVVDSVMLPAHAQTSTAPPPPPPPPAGCASTMTMIVTGVNDGVMADGGSYANQSTTITGAITPNPGAGVVINLQLFYDGVLVDSATPTTDANGEWSNPYAYGSGGTGVVELLTSVPAAPYDCATASWSATVIPS